MKRRAFLKAAAIAPLGAQVAGQEFALRCAGVTGIGGASTLGGMASEVPLPSSGYEPLRLTSFAEWLKTGGNLQRIKREAQNVNSIDPDILTLRLPLCTKIQWQRERNEKRLLEDQEESFLRRLARHGHVEWWGD